jgi:hypothetical protein
MEIAAEPHGLSNVLTICPDGSPEYCQNIYHLAPLT